MTRAELKRNAREKLGGQLFGPNWVNAVLVMAIFYILTGAVNGIAGFGTLIMLVIGGPLSYGVAKLFLQQCDDGQKMNPTEVFKGFSEDFGGSFILLSVKIPFHCLMVHFADHSGHCKNVFLLHGIFYKSRSSII